MRRGFLGVVVVCERFFNTGNRGLGWRIHESVEDTKLSTNKQHSLSLSLDENRRQPLNQFYQARYWFAVRAGKIGLPVGGDLS